MTAATLSEQLKAGTTALHRKAERSGIMVTMLHGQIHRSDYVRLLGDLQALYTALEPALLQHAPPLGFDRTLLQALSRQAALADDLRVLHGEARAEPLALSTSGRAYVRQLQDVERTRPALLIAHAYVRYLGDLSGGQMLGGIVARALGLDPHAPGLSFYRFPSPGAAMLAQRFRIALDQLPDEDRYGRLADALVAEACSAFERHCEWFTELAAPPL